MALHHGRELVFTLSGSNFVPRNPDQGLLERKGNGWEYLSADNERLVFDNDGRLLRQTTTALGTRYLAYTANGINVDDEAGNRLTFSEDGKHQPTSLRTPDGQVTYSYDSGRLTAVTRSNGEGSLTRRYHYEDSRNGSLLTGITDERGVRYASWHYDNQGRAISSEHATGAEKISLSHHGGYSTRVTNEYGKQAIYYFQVVNGSRHIVAIEGEPSPNCPSSNSTFTYDERGLLTSKRDNNGNLTTYQYNARGLETSR
ncbi:RHS repeat protein, partial [Pseudomonas aeruginosa]|nr:RHS repeat protein [Pseudomonas aeruginosa]MCO3089886.1 RHS repeat protein [Pseudomonas aeruginosa]MCO3537716.1 RHS repeat protein [Pseudomonas aeruginosa]